MKFNIGELIFVLATSVILICTLQSYKKMTTHNA